MINELVRYWNSTRSRKSLSGPPANSRRSRPRPLIEALESRYVLDSTVVFNEIMYHPRVDDGPEWIELHNQQGVDVDISGWSLDDGVEYVFPEGTVVPQRGYLVVTADPQAMRPTESEVLGPYIGSLANNGERIELRNNNGRVMDDVAYNDSFPWPVGPDGSGATLTKIELNGTSTQPQNWTVSSQVGGTPGERNFPSDIVEFFPIDFHDVGDVASVHIPADDRLGANWTQLGFVEGGQGEAWTAQATGVGFFQGEQQTPYPDAVLADSPLAYWRFGEGDVTESAENLGTLGAAAAGVYDAEASLGSASLVGDSLDGSMAISPDATIRPFSSPDFEKVGPEGRTVEFWFTLDEVPTREASLVGDGEGALDYGLIVSITDESLVRVRMKTDISFLGISQYDGDREIPLNTPVHVVANWSAASGESQLFLDGVEVPQINPRGPVPNDGNAISTDNPIFVGRDRRTSGNPPVKIDEVAIYDYLLSHDRISSHFESGRPRFSGLFATDVAEMYPSRSSTYIRSEFELADDVAVDQLTLDVWYDDGFVAYLNGVEVARRNVDGPVRYDSTATTGRTFDEASGVLSLDLSDSIGLLEVGQNVLALHGLNVMPDDADFLLSPRLYALGHFVPPEAPPEVAFNEISSADSETFQIELQNDGATPAVLDGLKIVLEGDTQREFTFPPTSMQPGAFLSLSAAELGFQPASGDHVFLYNADRSSVIDAREVTNRLRGRSTEHGQRWLFPADSTPGRQNQFLNNTDVVINEIMYHAPIVRGTPDVEPPEQWIELYNRGTQPVDLTGWSFDDGIQFDFAPGTTMGAGEYVLISNDAEALATKYPMVRSIVGEFSGKLSHGGERIELIDAFGNPVDEVDYRDEGRWARWADAGGSSLELRDPDADNAQPESWQASDASAGGVWETISYRAPASGTFGPTQYHELVLGLIDAGGVLLDDISVVEDPDGDARQLIQNGTFDGDTPGEAAAHWRIIGTHEESRVVVDPDDPNNHVLRMVASGATEHMHNHAETTLKSGDTYVTISNSKEYEISFRARWEHGSDLLNSRLYFNRAPKTTQLAIPHEWGTPGARNSRFVDNIGPTYANLQHSPTVPLPGQAVTVSVDATDPDGIRGLTLHYLVDGGDSGSVAMSGDASGRYSAQIPGYDEGAIVQFYVDGLDDRGATSAFPAAGPDSRALYFVEDGQGSDLGVHNFRIVMLSADADRLHEETNVMSNARQGATVIYDNADVYYDSGVRLKGSERGRNRAVRVGFNIQFDPLNLFRGVHETIGIDRSGSGDEFNQKEVLVKQTMNHAGGVTDLMDDLIYIIAPRSANTGSALLQMSRYKNVFLDSQFENGGDGGLFKYELVYYPTTTTGGPEGLKKPNPDSVVGVNVRPQGTKENHRWTFLNRSNVERDDYAQLMNALDVFTLNGDAFYERADEVLDVDQWLRSFAVQTLWGVQDNYTSGSQHNAYFYFRPSDGRMLFFPWDVDFTARAGATSSLIQNNDLRKITSLAENKHFYYGHIHDIVTTSFNNEYMNRWIDHYEQFLTGSQSFQTYKNYINTRSGHALDVISNEVPMVEFEVTTNDGQVITTDQSRVVLEGDGWVDVREIRLAGNTTPLRVTWPTIGSWSMELPVALGTNELMLEAYNIRGELVGSDSIVVTSTSSNRVNDSLRISEINYHPADPTATELAADPFLEATQFEFIELTNIGPLPIDPAGAHFTAGIDFTFPSMQIDPGERIVIAQDLSAFQLRYGDGIVPVGEFASGKLSNGGERLTLVDGLGETITSFSYSDNDPWPVLADGSGATIEVIDVAGTAVGRFGKSYSWRASTKFGGSPGKVGDASVGVVINEILARTDPPLTETDSIELWNSTDNAIDIGGWFLSDARNDLLKFQIPLGTSLDPGQYIVFDESDFNPSLGGSPTDFSLSGTRGDDVYLVTVDDAGHVDTFVDDVHFDASANGESWGRIENESGLAPMASTTLGGANSAPRVGPLIISEIYYDPPFAIDESTTDDREFIEVHNPTGVSVDLTDWRVRGGIDYDFDDGLQIDARSTLVIISFDPNGVENAARVDAFRAAHDIGDEVVLVGGYSGQLSDTGESVVLQRPGSAPLDEPSFTPRLTEDSVHYDEFAPWATSAAGGGDSLQRSGTNLLGDLPGSWTAAAPTPGQFIVEGVGDFNQDGIIDDKDIDLLFDAVHTGGDDAFDLDASGTVDQSDVLYLVENVIGTFMGDANLDGKVGSQDLNRTGINWLESGPIGWQGGDFNGDDHVNAADLNWIGRNWLKGDVDNIVARLPRAAEPLAVRAPGIDIVANEQETTSVRMAISDSCWDPQSSDEENGAVDSPRSVTWRARRFVRHTVADRLGSNETSETLEVSSAVDQFFSRFGR